MKEIAVFSLRRQTAQASKGDELANLHADGQHDDGNPKIIEALLNGKNRVVVQPP
jgi:hypothetical protein